jgi:cytidine deaminase
MPTITAELLDRLKTLRSRAYAPYSDHPVAAVVESASGQHFGGTNVEVAHFKSTCAESSAISAMIAAGETHVSRVIILGPGAQACTPCGDCRQRLREFGAADLPIIAVDDSGAIIFDKTLEALLPDSFGPDHLPT